MFTQESSSRTSPKFPSVREPSPGTVFVDRTHMSRRASGIERITEELFSPEALAPLRAEGVDASGGKLSIILSQMVRNPAAAVLRPGAVWIFPGYPPSPLFSLLKARSVLYVHDLFLITRKGELNRSAKLYMAPLFKAALNGLRYFLTNSETTAAALGPYVRSDARVLTYRPSVRNVFALGVNASPGRRGADAPLILGALGTVEPRKNLLAAANLAQALAGALGRPVELHVVGRRGWGGDYDRLARLPHVRLHGFLDDEAIRTVVDTFDLFVCTSHDEGLGLPLLEVQYAGLPIIAPDLPVFREVLGESGWYVYPDRIEAAARDLAERLRSDDGRRASARLGPANVERWNRNAERDRKAVIAFLSDLTRTAARSAQGFAGLHARKTDPLS